MPELYLDELLLGELDLVPELGAGADQLLLGGEERAEGGQLGLAQVPQQTGLDLAAVGSSLTSAANRLICEVVQTRRRSLLGPSPG